MQQPLTKTTAADNAATAGKKGTAVHTSAYNSELVGVIKFVSVYTDGDYIYFALENQPTSHPTCNPFYFVIQGSVPAERRSQIMARLMTAYAMKEEIRIGYDAQGDCADGFLRVHRVG